MGYEADKLVLFAETDAGLQKRSKSVAATVDKKMKAGTYDHRKAPNLWQPWVEAAAKQYARQVDEKTRFSATVRREAAKRKANQFIAEYFHLAKPEVPGAEVFANKRGLNPWDFRWHVPNARDATTRGRITCEKFLPGLSEVKKKVKAAIREAEKARKAASKPRKTKFPIQLKTGGKELVDGYVLGNYGTRKSKWFWDFTDLRNGMLMTTYPPIETKKEAMQHLLGLHSGGAPYREKRRRAADEGHAEAKKRRELRGAKL